MLSVPMDPTLRTGPRGPRPYNYLHTTCFAARPVTGRVG